MGVTNAQSRRYLFIFLLINFCFILNIFTNNEGDFARLSPGEVSGLNWQVPSIGLTDPPQAVDDTAHVSLNTTTAIDVLANDVISGTLIAQQILPWAPWHGMAVVNPDGSISYTPLLNYCGEDFFLYEICNFIGCDTAEVRIFIYCDELSDLEAVNAFSPNGDGINDFFTIRGIEHFPQNRLQIFNRWGNLVFDGRDYQGNWDGSWLGATVPDGTYFYLLTLPDRDPLKGYVQVHR